MAMHIPSAAVAAPLVAARAALVASALLCGAGAALGQAYEKRSDDFVLRASTVSTTQLSEQTLAEHGVDRAPNTAVLNVTLQQRRGNALHNVPAEVDVRVRNLYGVRTPVQMREVRVNGQVSYLGSYRFAPREVLDFRVTARPADAPVPLVLNFRDRLGRH